MYAEIKAVHVGCAAVSICGFIARGVLGLRGAPPPAARWARAAPHVVDTVLLASALWLAWRSAQLPFVQGWLTAKVLALAAYIALGSLALRAGRSRRVRATAFALALGVFAYIVSVAITRDPLGPLAALRGA
ncbi:MAG: SirB2 family protein [Burkholderiales bacterium]|nr:SirB2 family protein [Burkholderiales bacterium]